MTEIVTPINVTRFQRYLMDSGFCRDRSEHLIQGFKEGFDIGYRGPLIRQDTSNNIPLNLGTPQDLWDKLMKEVSMHRYAGPYKKIPYVNYMQSPIGLVPKSGNKTRLIFHLSYNFGREENKFSLNHFTPTDWCTVKYNDLDYAVRTCLNVGNQVRDLARHQDQELQQIVGREVLSSIYLSKSDVQSAFRILPILPKQRCWLLMMAKNPNDGATEYFVEKNLPFGASVSCAQFTILSEALKHIIEFNTGRFHTVTNYLDDFLFIGSDEEESNNMVRSFMDLCGEIGVPLSLEKTEWASLSIEFLGLLINGHTRTISIPQEKVNKALSLVRQVIHRKKVTVKFIQRLTGTLNFLNKAIVPGRMFTRLMYGKLRIKDKEGNPLKQYHHVNLGSTVLKDCAIWEAFLNNADSKQLCRPFVDFDKSKKGTKTLEFYTDSSLNVRYGYGGVFNNRWIIGKWGEHFIRTQRPSIQFLELYALVAGIITWSNENQLKNARVEIYCDNQPVQGMVNTLTTGCEQCMKLIRILMVDNMRSNRRVFVKYIKSKDNELADALSRMDLKRFWRNAPENMNKIPDIVPDCINPVSKVWFGDLHDLLDQVGSNPIDLI